MIDDQVREITVAAAREDRTRTDRRSGAGDRHRQPREMIARGSIGDQVRGIAVASHTRVRDSVCNPTTHWNFILKEPKRLKDL